MPLEYQEKKLLDQSVKNLQRLIKEAKTTSRAIKVERGEEVEEEEK